MSHLINACKPALKGSAQGFTLLEIMVSLSIVAIVFVSLFKMQSSNIVLAEYGHFHSTAPILARQTIARIGQDLEDESNLSGDFGENFQGYKWNVKISEYQTFDSAIISETSAKKLKRVEVEISKGKNLFTLVVWRYVANG